MTTIAGHRFALGWRSTTCKRFLPQVRGRSSVSSIALRQGELRLLVAGDIAPAGLTLREDVRTRLAAVLVLQLHPLDDEEKERALQAHARSRGFELPPEAARYLLLHGRRDLRWLLTVLDALDRYSLQTRRPITLSLTREVLQAARAGGGAPGDAES